MQITLHLTLGCFLAVLWHIYNVSSRGQTDHISLSFFSLHREAWAPTALSSFPSSVWPRWSTSGWWCQRPRTRPSWRSARCLLRRTKSRSNWVTASFHWKRAKKARRMPWRSRPSEEKWEHWEKKKCSPQGDTRAAGGHGQCFNLDRFLFMRNHCTSFCVQLCQCLLKILWILIRALESF